MNTAWIGTASTLGGAVLAGGLGWLRDWRAEARQERRDRAQRQHDVSESRYAERRDVYVGFANEWRRGQRMLDDFQQQHPDQTPGEQGFDGPLQGLEDALTLVTLMGPIEVSDAASEAARHLNNITFSSGSTYEESVTAYDTFITLSRRALKLEQS